MSAGLDFEVAAGAAYRTSSPPIIVPRNCAQGSFAPQNGGFKVQSRFAGKFAAVGGQQVMAPQELLQQVSWKHFFVDTAQWSDSRQGKPTRSHHPNIEHEVCKVPLWFNSRLKPVWVEPQEVAVMDTASFVGKTHETLHTSGPGTGAFASSSQGHGVEIRLNSSRKRCEDGPISEAVDALERLVQRGCNVPNHLFYRVLKKCIQDKNLALGRHIHDLIVSSGNEGDSFLATHLIGFYASHGRLEEAMRVFTKVSTPDAYNWASIIFAHARHGEATEAAEAIRLYRIMCQSTSVKPDDRIYAAVLKACTAAGDLVTGKEVHTDVLASAREPDRFVQAGLINMYAKCGSLEDARRVFDNLSERDVVIWTTMITGYTQHRMGAEALRLYTSMKQQGFAPPDSVTYVCLLRACATVGAAALNEGKQLHAQIKKQGLQGDSLNGSLVNMYAKCGSLEDASTVFHSLAKRDVVTWTAMIAGYVQQGMGQEALNLYRRMRQEGLSPPDCIAYVCLLQACTCVGVGAFDEGKQLHAEIMARGLQEDVVLGGSLVNMYAKCGSLKDAQRLFDEIPERNVVAWNAILGGYAQHGMGQKALDLYKIMRQQGRSCPPNCVTYICLLQACASIGAAALHEGRRLHAEIEDRGMQEDLVIGGSLVNMYAKCGSLEQARKLFDELPERNTVAWNAMITGYVQQGMGQDALGLYSSMQTEGLAPTSVTYVCLLQACAIVGVEALQEGELLHAEIAERGLEEDAVLRGSLINMYSKCGRLEEARTVFDKVVDRDVVMWTAMIAGYAQQGMGEEALRIYRSMRQEGLTLPNAVTYVCLLQACASVGVGALDEGKQLHAQIREQGLQEDDGVLAVSLVNMYVKCGSLEDARSLFDKLARRNVVAWTTMIAGYAQQGMGQEALSLYSKMKQDVDLAPDCFTYVSLLQACASVGVEALSDGKQLHAQIEQLGLEDDAVVGGSLVNMHAKCGDLQDARNLFQKLQERNLVAWNAMISGYAQQGMSDDAISLYSRMQQEGLTPDSVTYAALLLACANVGSGALDQGRQLHMQINEQGHEEELGLAVNLVNMYAKCGSLEDARKLFDKLDERNLVTWNAMIAGYAQQGMGQEAIALYHSMQQHEGLTPNSVTYVCLLQACAAVAALPLGEHLHAEIEERGMLADGIVGGALVNMYAKCGSMFDSQRVFDLLSDRSIEAWGALVSGYARQGDSQIVFDLLDKMRLDGMQPDGITFLSILAMCSHVGLVEKGREYFEVMRTNYGIRATMEHYICMVDLLGRAGHLEEALQMAQSMPFSPNAVVWRTLLGACRKWKNVEIGQQAFKRVLSVDDKDAASYVLMSNIYGSNQLWDEAKDMQARRMRLGAWKKPGQSWWTDMNGVVHTFLVGDKKHPESEGIYARLRQLIPKMKKEGYVPHLESALLDAPDDQKEAELCGHSEKLAIAYALNKTAEGTTIRIAKNLRVCEDCHLATAYISQVEQRTIICRDASRFHVYKEGKCSCGDYW